MKSLDQEIKYNIDLETSKISIKLTPEKVIKLFRRISDDNVSFMGFSPVWSRPEWMVCQTLAIPPPAVRPSVKHDSQQRSEDDITHIIVNIIKANKLVLHSFGHSDHTEVISESVGDTRESNLILRGGDNHANVGYGSQVEIFLVYCYF